jgi:hypothetical protein
MTGTETWTECPGCDTPVVLVECLGRPRPFESAADAGPDHLRKHHCAA